LLNLPLYHLISHGGEDYHSLKSLFDEDLLTEGVLPQEFLKITISKDFEILLDQMRSESNKKDAESLLF
jgi:hypothetical protein